MIRQISHVCFGTTDLLKTVEFYREHFGSEIAHEFRNATGALYGVFLSVGTSFVEFFTIPEAPPPGGIFRHFCFEVDDIEAAAAHFNAAGMQAEVKRGKTDRTLNFWIEDPNGIKIEFHQYDSQSVVKRG